MKVRNYYGHYIVYLHTDDEDENTGDEEQHDTTEYRPDDEQNVGVGFRVGHVAADVDRQLVRVETVRVETGRVHAL